MPSKKDIVMLLIQFFTQRKPGQSPHLDIIHTIKKEVRVELSKLAARILVGLSVAILMTWSLIRVGGVIQTYLEQADQGPLLQIIIFGGVSILCGGGLYFLFKERSSRTPTPTPAASPPMDFQSLFMSFTQGLIEGLNKNRSSSKTDPSPLPNTTTAPQTEPTASRKAEKVGH